MITFGSLKSKFLKDRAQAMEWSRKVSIDHHQLSSLPTILQHFIKKSGFQSQPILNAKIEWKNARLRFSETSTWAAIECSQCNFLPDPIRLAYMKARRFGLFSFEALDSFQHGIGQMLIRACNLITLSDSKGYEMDKAELVTILAETMIIPAYALQSYIRWEEIDDKTLRATISFHQVKASGIFHFNKDHEIVKFETYDRFYTDKKGMYHQIQWTAEAGDYIRKDGLSFPTSFKATWNKHEGDFEYFKGTIRSITINT